MVSVASDDPDNVSASWLSKRTGLSSSTVRTKCAVINVGTKGKALYPREQALTLLSKKG